MGVFGEGAEVGFGGGWGKQADRDEADEAGQKGGEDGVAVGDDTDGISMRHRAGMDPDAKR